MQFTKLLPKKLNISKLILILCLGIAFHSTAQTTLSPSISYNWSSDSIISIKTQGTNFNPAFLVNLKFSSTDLKKEILIHKEDSVLIGKGIFQTRHKLKLSKEILDQFDSSFVIIILFENIRTNAPLAERKVKIFRPIRKLPTLSITDSSLNFIYSGKEMFTAKIMVSSDTNNLSHSKDASEFALSNDTSILAWELIKEQPFQSRGIMIEIMDEGEQLLSKPVYYENGIFKDLISHSAKNEDPSMLEKATNAFDLSGELYIENNSFSSSPEHSNGLQYPNTIFRLSNTVSIYGIPFQLNAHHTTNDNIDPSFRNFFSFSLDVNAYRNQLREELIAGDLANQYSIPEINQDIEFNQASIDHLKKTKSTLLKYPNEKIELDSLLEGDVKQLIASELKDTASLDLTNDSISNFTDSISIDSNLNATKINEINNYVNRLEASNKYKNQLKNQKIKAPKSFDRSAFKGNKLYQKAQSQRLASLFLRFEKLEIGNFYQYAGKYSIRDIEMIGFNAEFLINPNNKIGFLRGKINDFQAFNLDNIERNIQVTSIGLSNSHYKSFSPSIRVTEYDDKSINSEDGGVNPKNYVTSLGVLGEVGGFLFYEGEINRSAANWSSTISEQDQFLRNTAIYGKVEVSPFNFLDLNVKYDRVGSNYRSDGVYFLVRDVQSYSVGSHLKLFKNKIYFKNDYTLISRNAEQKELLNESKKLFFDLGSRFKRIPNFQIVHAPISVDIANKLDTSFANLNAFSSVTIARIFYVKKVRKTIYNTALIYSEILNDYFEGTNKQRGFQHFIGISNPKTQFSFTSSYAEVFEKVRFISSNLSHQLKDWVRGSLYYAKNFQDDRYSDIIRMKFDFKVGKSILLGLGGAALFEKNRNTNLGSTVSLRYIY